MSAPDDLQKLWQAEGTKEEEPMVWKALIQEKRSSWDELVRSEDLTWYIVALCFAPLTLWAAWKAKYPWVRVGYGLMALTLALSSISTWLAARQLPKGPERSLRQHLEALLQSYDRRLRFIRIGRWWVMAGLTSGVLAVFLGVPGNNLKWWAFAMLLVLAFNIASWMSCNRSIARISSKREGSLRLLQSLLAGEQDAC